MRKFDNNYIVGAYVRLSKEDDRSDESSSIDSQKLIIESFAKFNNLKINEFYSDDGFTGSNFNRPGFERLKSDIEDGVINCVIVKDLSRLGRELYETGAYIEEYFLSKNVRFIAINDGYDSLVGDSMLGIRLSVNDLYLRDTSKKIRSSFDAKRKKGDYIGSHPLLGYKKDPDNSNKLIIDEVASEYVKMIFAFALEGHGLSKIASLMTEANIPIPSIYKNETYRCNQYANIKGTGLWRVQTVLKILTNQMYLGHMVQGRWKKVSYNSKKIVETKKSEWYIVKNTHEAIIDEDTFNKAQRILKKSKRLSSQSKGNHLLQGLLKCKECGHRMNISQKSPTAGKFAQCNHYQALGKYGVCTNHRINYNALEADILHYLKDIGIKLSKSFDTKLSLDKVMELQMKEEQQITREINEQYKHNEKVTKILENLYEDRLNEVISARQYSTLAKKYDDELIKIESKLTSLNERMKKLHDENQTEVYERTKETIDKFVRLENINRGLIVDLINKIEVDSERNIEVYFNADMHALISEAL